MTIRQIIETYLRENHFDGLFCDECGCDLDDLMPCSSEGALSCQPGYKHPCDCEEGHAYHVRPDCLHQPNTPAVAGDPIFCIKCRVSL